MFNEPDEIYTTELSRDFVLRAMPIEEISTSGSPSRGWYICIPSEGFHYIHDDGEIRLSALAPEGASAFWNDRNSAVEFLSDWREARIKEGVV